MIKNNLLKFTLTILAAGALAAPLHAADPAKPAPSPAAANDTSASEKSAKADRMPGFRGVIASVDKAAKTITLESKKGEGRTFTILDDAKLSKGKETATWDDLTAGQKVSGTYKKTADGKMEVSSLKISAAAGDKAEKAGAAKGEKSETSEMKPATEKKK